MTRQRTSQPTQLTIHIQHLSVCWKLFVCHLCVLICMNVFAYFISLLSLCSCLKRFLRILLICALLMHQACAHVCLSGCMHILTCASSAFFAFCFPSFVVYCEIFFEIAFLATQRDKKHTKAHTDEHRHSQACQAHTCIRRQFCRQGQSK